MRIKSHIWVSAYLRRLDGAFIPAAVVRRGDADAGAVYIKLSYLDGRAQVFAPVPPYALDSSASAMKRDGILLEEGRAWQGVFEAPASDSDVDSYLHRQQANDPDMWIIDVEDRNGRHLIGQTEYAGLALA